MWKDNIQRLFRYRKINPSSALWEQLEAQLAESETLPTEQKSGKLWYYTAAAAVLLCLAIGYLWQQHTEINNDLQVSKKLIVIKSSVPTTSPHSTVPTTLKDSQCSSYPSILKNSQYDSYLTSSEEVITLIDINAVDTLFTQYTANAIQNQITKQMENQMAADLQHLSPEYLALVATTQAELNQYVTEKYQQDKTFNTIEKEQLKDKVKLLAEKLLKEIGTRVVLNNKS
ncbi:anti-sigma factor [Capnocytophaga sp. oral taxon 903]|uniref:anti-sigma factor n=1 Tax=Capnocytophaga sp. oral taxon 903 TaxID=2748317 RepID=UPI0015BB66F6|nr:anti-sigma factor [Capnocytophaga sp. oral taxon 903]NWO29451.1 anti-sigma factor [Capnocytophaga sp. oral taxon 903]